MMVVMEFLLRTRLSWFFVIFFLVFFDLALMLKGTTFTPAALTLFSVNSFLYGFYIAPVLSAQKARTDDLARIIRGEANALFDILIKTKKLPRKTRNRVQDMVEEYIQASFKERKPAEGEDEYQTLITFCLNYKGAAPDQIEKILNGLVANQQNRSALSQQLGNRVFSNEWLIMLVLFGITIGFVVMFDVGRNIVMLVVKALLCTGLSMLMINLLKLSTLTHKKARSLWNPLDTLATSRFRRID